MGIYLYLVNMWYVYFYSCHVFSHRCLHFFVHVFVYILYNGGDPPSTYTWWSRNLLIVAIDYRSATSMVQLGKYGDHHTDASENLSNQLRYNILPPPPPKTNMLVEITIFNRRCIFKSLFFQPVMLVFVFFFFEIHSLQTGKISRSTGERISSTQWYQ